MKTKKRILIAALTLLPTFAANAQFEKELYTCDGETYSLLKNLSDSQLGNGKIYLFTTTHQDLAWLNHIDACIADRDTLWLTPFLKRLQDDPTFKMDIEQTSIVMEYLHRHPDTKPLFDKYIAEGRICVGGTYIQPYEEMYSGEALARQFYFGTRWLKKTFNGYNTLSYFNVDVPGRTLQMPQIMLTGARIFRTRLTMMIYAISCLRSMVLSGEAIGRIPRIISILKNSADNFYGSR